MGNIGKKKPSLLFISIFLMILSINFFCISQKRGLFGDEQLSICCSNNISITKNFLQEDIHEGIYTGEQLKKMYFWNNSSIKDIFLDLKYLYLKNADNSHTNLYYSLLRIGFSGVDFNDIDYFILRGCLLNIVFFCFAFFFMYKLLALLFDNDILSISLGLLVAFLNTGTLTNLTFLREYYLQMTMFIVLSYFVVKNITNYEKEKLDLTVKNICVLAFVTALTLLSGYYSALFVLFLYLWMTYKPLKNKDYAFLKYIAKTLGLSVLFTLIIYPLYFTGLLFSDHGLFEVQKSIRMEVNVVKCIAYVFNTIQYHFINFVLYLPVLLLCFVMLFLPNKKAENSENKTNLNVLILLIISFIFCILVILLRQNSIPYYRYMAATYPLITIIIPYLCNKKAFKPICSVLFIIIYLYAAFISPANSNDSKGKFYYAVKRYIYKEDRDIFDKMQALNLPIFIYENNFHWRKYKILAFLKDQNIFYIGNLDLIPKGQKFIFLSLYSKSPLPDFLKDKKPNIIIPECSCIGFILTKE